MANSQLIDNTYKIPDDVINYIKTILISNPTGDGVKRAKFVINNKVLTYQALKRIKHDLEHSVNKIQYALAGGDLMLSYINKILNSERANVNISKNVTSDAHIDIMRGNHVQKNI